eukprot:TRINITY_DN63216_c0_g1_i1.p2 TRINITY_DN63216_c0_g1~~TRINITY_DN63216_c0_g1_i1.p2  ORF type:complete len:147 (-),score=28.61 TRINITY_DN63216_c0_g1_i1:1399-1839(-)
MHIFTKSQVEELQHLFTLFDIDGDGRVTVSELSQRLSAIGEDLSPELEDVLTAIQHTKGDQGLEFTEFLNIVSEGTSTASSDDDLHEEFSSIDADGDGFITPNELRRALGSTVSTPQIKQLFNCVDSDGDGRITFSDYVHTVSVMF